MDKSKKLKSAKTGPWNYFHDCPICQGMKHGRGQTAEDLTKLFKEAEAKQRKDKNSQGGVDL